MLTYGWLAGEELFGGLGETSVGIDSGKYFQMSRFYFVYSC